VAHTYNPKYLGGRDQEDQDSKPARSNSSRDPISKNPSKNRAGSERERGRDRQTDRQKHLLLKYFTTQNPQYVALWI
jgi:hypothetical protein